MPRPRHTQRGATIETDRGARKPLQELADELGYRVVERTLQRGHGGSCKPVAKVRAVGQRAGSVTARSSRTSWCATVARTTTQLGCAEEELVAGCVNFCRTKPGIALGAWPGARNSVSPTRIYPAFAEPALAFASPRCSA